MMVAELTPQQKLMARMVHTMDKPVPPLDMNPQKRHPLAGRTPGVRATSRQSLRQEQSTLGPKQMELLRIIEKGSRPVNDRELVAHLGWSISSITARRNELVEAGRVEEAFRQVDPKTNKRVIYWKAVS